MSRRVVTKMAKERGGKYQWVCASDVRTRELMEYLCDDGPAQCEKCLGCAFGKRFVDECLRGIIKQPGPPESLGHARRRDAYAAKMRALIQEMDEGVPVETLRVKYKYATARQVRRSVSRFEKMRFPVSKQENAEAMGVGHTSPSSYHK
jgi:hypothetical protein